ncbi:Arm DNA-binding domain-containing protein [Pseudoxanthomonas suwonensis]|uniref:Arm DNA-binding domain-containing protein n=1 Tax=Pseudoxanthomonas suwonensis TaxID=314722 RepID=UPI0009E4C2F6
MPLLRLSKSVIDDATAREKDYELRDTLVPGFLCKVTPTGRKVFMLAYRTNWGERRKPSIGKFGELTVEQARAIAKDMLADIRRGEDPSAEKRAMRQAPTVSRGLCRRANSPPARARWPATARPRQRWSYARRGR